MVVVPTLNNNTNTITNTNTSTKPILVLIRYRHKYQYQYEYQFRYHIKGTCCSSYMTIAGNGEKQGRSLDVVVLLVARHCARPEWPKLGAQCRLKDKVGWKLCRKCLLLFFKRTIRFSPNLFLEMDTFRTDQNTFSICSYNWITSVGSSDFKISNPEI